jgi:hypothetical protein
VSHVETPGINAQQPLHPGDQIGLRGFDHQMKVVAHQTPGMHLPLRFGADLLQGGHEQPPVIVVPKNLSPTVTPIHHMINRAGIFNPQRSRHGALSRNGASVSIVGTDTCMERGLGEHHSGELHRGSAEAKAEQIVAEELKGLGWAEADLKSRRKNDPDKLEIGARLRRETTLTIKAIAARVGLGSSKGANANLHRHMQGGGQRAKGKVLSGRRRT